MSLNFTGAAAFNQVFKNITKAIPFNPDWANNTGYYDHAVEGAHAPALESGEMVKTTSTNNRKIIIVGTCIGNLVIFQRYSNNDESVIVYNASRQFDALYSPLLGRPLTYDNIQFLLSHDNGENVFANTLHDFLKQNAGKVVQPVTAIQAWSTVENAKQE